MSSLKDDFLLLVERINHGRELRNTGFEPVYYLVFPPEQILEVKRQTRAWISKLQHDGWEVVRFSIAEHVDSLLREAPLRKLWISADERTPLDWDKANQSLSNFLKNGTLESRLTSTLNDLKNKDKAIVLVTDLEALHPYMRVGALESRLQGHFEVPTVFLYPGIRTGKSRLKFLGFYPEDGNYRSMHVGG